MSGIWEDTIYFSYDIPVDLTCSILLGALFFRMYAYTAWEETTAWQSSCLSSMYVLYTRQLNEDSSLNRLQ